jgi:hypothetical protein
VIYYAEKSLGYDMDIQCYPISNGVSSIFSIFSDTEEKQGGQSKPNAHQELSTNWMIPGSAILGNLLNLDNSSQLMITRFLFPQCWHP